MKVLLVDDDPDIRRIGLLSLEAIGGFATTVAGSAEEALALATSDLPELILMDVVMPGLDGLAGLAALRAVPALRAIPVVFLTARADPADEQRYLDAGALGVVRKPFDPMTLPAKLRALLATR